MSKDVESVHGQDEPVLEEAFGEGGVPHHVVRVHALCLVTSAAVERQVGVELEAPWKPGLGGQAVVEVEGVDGDEVLAAAGQVVPGAGGFRPHLDVSWERVVEAELAAAVDVLHGAALRGGSLRDPDKVHGMVQA